MRSLAILFLCTLPGILCDGVIIRNDLQMPIPPSPSSIQPRQSVNDINAPVARDSFWSRMKKQSQQQQQGTPAEAFQGEGWYDEPSSEHYDNQSSNQDSIQPSLRSSDSSYSDFEADQFQARPLFLEKQLPDPFACPWLPASTTDFAHDIAPGWPSSPSSQFSSSSLSTSWDSRPLPLPYYSDSSSSSSSSGFRRRISSLSASSFSPSSSSSFSSSSSPEVLILPEQNMASENGLDLAPIIHVTTQHCGCNVTTTSSTTPASSVTVLPTSTMTNSTTTSMPSCTGGMTVTTTALPTPACYQVVICGPKLGPGNAGQQVEQFVASLGGSGQFNVTDANNGKLINVEGAFSGSSTGNSNSTGGSTMTQKSAFVGQNDGGNGSGGSSNNGNSQNNIWQSAWDNQGNGSNPNNGSSSSMISSQSSNNSGGTLSKQEIVRGYSDMTPTQVEELKQAKEEQHRQQEDNSKNPDSINDLTNVDDDKDKDDLDEEEKDFVEAAANDANNNLRSSSILTGLLVGFVMFLLQ